MRWFLHFLKQWMRFFGIIMVKIGYLMMGIRKPYRIPVYIIENLLRSVEIGIKVTDVLESAPLYVTFGVEIKSSNFDRIDWSYFIMELVLQLGCNFTDVSLRYTGTGNGNEIYDINITKTALSNLEKATPFRNPDLYEKRDNEYLLNRSLELSGKTEITPEVLASELNITKFRADKLYNQLVKSKSLAKPVTKRKKLMN